MAYRLLADGLVAVHLAFILFVVGGGLLVLRWHGMAVLHLPAVAWAVYIEFTGTICPLTPWENALRNRAGDAGYPGGFIEHYLVPVIYPANLTSRMQMYFGVLVIVVNALAYAFALRRRKCG
jgi:hypothetical protein